MESQHGEPQAAAGEGPSPLWLFGGGASSGGGAAAQRAASRALPPEICEKVYALLYGSERKVLRLVSSSARAYHDTDVTSLRFEGSDALTGLRLLESGAAAQPPRFQHVRSVMFSGDWGSEAHEGTPAQANMLAAALPALQALPVLRTIELSDVMHPTPPLLAAIADGLPTATPWLERIFWECCAPAVRVACFSAAAKLPALRDMGWASCIEGEFEDEHQLSSGDYARMAASLSTPGAFEYVQELRIAVNPAAAAALATARLPALTNLSLTYDDAILEPLSSAPSLQLIAAAPWLSQLTYLWVTGYNEAPPGDVSAASMLHLEFLVWMPAGRDDASGTVAALSRMLAAAPLGELMLELKPGPEQPSLTRAALAALLAAPGPAGAVEAFTLHSGVLDGEAPRGAHPLAALPAARLPALRSLDVREAPGATCDFMAALGAAPWAAQLAYLHLSSDADGLDALYHASSLALGEVPQACAAAEALAAAPLTSLEWLNFGVWALPLEAMLVVVRAPWFASLDGISMRAEEDERQALRAASPAYAALCERGHAR